MVSVVETAGPSPGAWYMECDDPGAGRLARVTVRSIGRRPRGLHELMQLDEELCEGRASACG